MQSVVVDHQVLVMVVVLDHCSACTLAGQNCLLKVPGHEEPCVIDAGRQGMLETLKDDNAAMIHMQFASTLT